MTDATLPLLPQYPGPTTLDAAGETARLSWAIEQLWSAINGTLAPTTLTVQDLTITGTLVATGLPTTDPTTAGEVYTNTEVLTLSAG